MNKVGLATMRAALMGLSLFVPVMGQTEEDVIKNMKEAQAAQSEVQDGIKARDAAKTQIAAQKLMNILQENRTFWGRQLMPATVKLANNSVAASRDVMEIARNGKMDTIQAAFDKMNTSCQACHDTHPEKQLKEKSANAKPYSPPKSLTVQTPAAPAKK